MAIGYHRNQQGAEKTRESIAGAGGKAVCLQADVRRSEEIRSLMDNAVRQLGPVDILVNNAGSLVQRLRLLELTEENGTRS